MRVRYTKNYDKTYKQLKRHFNENRNLEKILYFISKARDFSEVVNNPIFRMYGFERLKYELNDFYSFNLSKNRGTIRLIVRPKADFLELYLVHISYNHYKDFDIKKGDIDDE